MKQDEVGEEVMTKADTCSRSRAFVITLPPGENIILNMGGNSTRDWLRKTLWFWRDGSK